MSLVTRSATRNVLPSSHVILSRVFHAYAQRAAAPMVHELDEQMLADILRLPVAEITTRRHHARAEPGFVDFFGAAVRAVEIGYTTRRFAPAAIGVSPHVPALWSLRTVPCCTQTWQYLIDRCQRCGTRQGWQHAVSLNRCDRCCTRLDRADAQEVPAPLREGLGFIIGLLEPDQVRRGQSRAQLPGALEGLDGGLIFELALAMMPLTTAGHRRKRRSVPANSCQADYAAALSQSAEIVRAWPDSLEAALERAVVARSISRRNVRYTGISDHIPALKSKVLPAAVQTVISDALAPISAAPGTTPHNQVGMMDATELLKRPLKILAPERRAGRLRTRICLRAKRLFPTLDRAEVDHLGDFLRNRMSAEAASAALKLPAYAIRSISDAGHIALEEHPYVISLYRHAQLNAAEYARFKSALRAAARCEDKNPAADEAKGEEPVALHRVVRAMGGGFKPWGKIFDGLLTGAIPFTMSGDRISRIQISAKDARLLRSLDLSGLRPSSLEPTCSQRDAFEILNLPFKHASLLRPLAGADDNWEMSWAAVLELARTRITLTELCARTDLNSVRLEALLEAENCPRSDRFGWVRESALATLPRINARQSNRR